MRALAVAAAMAIAPLPAGAEEQGPFHFQATVATQAHPAFQAAYSGKKPLGDGRFGNSLQSVAESATSVVMDLSLTLRPWEGAELVFQPELAGGRGLSSTLGVAAFPSGEVYRVGNPEPTLIVARAALKQAVGPLTFVAGKYAIPEFFDNVPYANDPHTRFMSWGLWASAAYDYPADVRGYTWGLAADFSKDWWSARAGIFLEPKVANGARLETDILKARGLVVELEARSGPGAVRVLGFLNTANMGSYARAIAGHVQIEDTRAQGRTKAGMAASANYDFGRGLGAFIRASFNDGKNETWAFTEMDRSLAMGALQSGARWGRERDEAGAGLVVSGLSGPHRAYLEGGGYGFLIGDGALRYGAELLGELFYRAGVTEQVSLGVNYQPILHPAFNRDRGPVHVFTGRAHIAF
jgi:high affinity Mn2+ porin